MHCESCGKPATLHYTEVVGGDKHSVALCRACAQQRGLVVDPPMPPSASALPPMPQVQVTKIKATFGPSVFPARPAAPRRCGRCGTTLVALRKSGRVGCPDCYDTFREHLEPLLQRVHRATRHCGMARGAAGATPDPRRRRQELEGELREAVAAEDFERAARLRDELAQLRRERSESEPSA